MDIRYLAGFVDGEGSIGIAKVGPAGGKGYAIRLQIVNTNLSVLREIRREYGGHITRRKPENVTRHRVTWRLGIGGNMLLRLLQRLRPHLIIKKKQCELVLLMGPFRLSGEMAVMGEGFRTRMRRLNRKGP
jgi:hypothetical protein